MYRYIVLHARVSGTYNLLLEKQTIAANDKKTERIWFFFAGDTAK